MTNRYECGDILADSYFLTQNLELGLINLFTVTIVQIYFIYLKALKLLKVIHKISDWFEAKYLKTQYLRYFRRMVAKILSFKVRITKQKIMNILSCSCSKK